MIKNLLPALCALAFSSLFAQQPTHVLNGKTYFVYPYQQELGESPSRIFRMGVHHEEIITRDSLNRNVATVDVVPVKYYQRMDDSKSFKSVKKMVLQIRREYPGVFYTYDMPLEKDITPTLEPLPDGEYVQFYRDLPYVDAENVLRYRNDVVASVFFLKNNQLDGFAYWMSALGDTIKSGRFTEGLKEGAWTHHTYSFDKAGTVNGGLQLSGFLDGTYKDTLTVRAQYADGLLNGPYAFHHGKLPIETGAFKNGTEIGEWKHYTRKTMRQGFRIVELNEAVLVRHYTIPEKKLRGKSVIIRNMVPDLSDLDRTEFNVPYDNGFTSFGAFYSLYVEKEEEGLELAEEKSNSYPGEASEETAYYEDYNESLVPEDIDFSYGNHYRTFFMNGRDYSRNDLIDSLGYEFLFEGVYEEFHPNVQLKMRFEVKNGTLVKEEPVYWDNGNPVSIVNFLPETNEYEELVYDYNEQLMHHALYDKKGNFIRFVEGGLASNEHLINGRTYVASDYDDFYSYSVEDTLNHTVFSPVLLNETLWKIDSTSATTVQFDPVQRVVELQANTLDGTPAYHSVAEFSDDYESVRSEERFTTGKLSLHTQRNGAYLDYAGLVNNPNVPDTVLNRRAKFWQSQYELQSDNVLYYNEKPFSGKFSMTTNAPDFAVKASASSFSIRYANTEAQAATVAKTLKKYTKKHKPVLLSKYLTEEGMYNREVNMQVTYSLVPFIGLLFEPVSAEHFIVPTGNREEMMYGEEGIKMKTVSEKKAPAFDKNVSGQYIDGKPAGTWITKDQFGQVTSEVSFRNGEVDGTVRYYRTAYPEVTQSLVPDFGYEIDPRLKDSLPAKPVYYLHKIAHYRNGVLNGSYRELSWMGDTITKWEYVDGHLEGPTLERKKIAYTIADYENGGLNGIMQTYLTLPGHDSTLLYDLNFRNGALQGESKSYHLNGKLAKHGFFLMGQPIDDFEAFDTLGARYQYVKFLYNQPVEEKIWEENELSVRYTFDWRDSIYFNTGDIAGSSSLDEMLYNLGLGDGYQVPYYGRPSLVDKSGINYHMTKYYPNDTIARDGEIASGKKVGCWQFWNYEGRKLYEVEYFDSIVTTKDNIRFKSKGILTLLGEHGEDLSRSYIVEKVEKYDCSHTDHHEIRMLYTFWEKDPSQQRINGYVKNYYDNGVLQNEGQVKDGVATGVWKFYDPYGSLSQVGEYKLGKRQGRWLSGDLSQVKYMGDICLNPNLPNLEEIMGYQEKLLDISVVYYQMGVVKKREYYGVNMNNQDPPEEYLEPGYYDGEGY